MSHVVKKHKAFAGTTDELFAQCQSIIAELDSKAKIKLVSGKQQFKVIFGKKVDGIYINDRSQLDVAVIPGSESGSVVIARAFPVNPVGQPLTFGVRSNVGERIVDLFLGKLG